MLIIVNKQLLISGKKQITCNKNKINLTFNIKKGTVSI